MPLGIPSKWSVSDWQDTTWFINPWRSVGASGRDATPCEKAVPMLAGRQYALEARIPVRHNVWLAVPVIGRAGLAGATRTAVQSW